MRLHGQFSYPPRIPRTNWFQIIIAIRLMNGSVLGTKTDLTFLYKPRSNLSKGIDCTHDFINRQIRGSHGREVDFVVKFKRRFRGEI